jgi:gliding motility-associated-like protein
VRKPQLDLKLLLFLCFSVFTGNAIAQLGFCQGNSGDPIFVEDFGTGTDYGPPLPAGTTTYTFVGFNGPQDGEYTIGSNTFAYGWNLPSDHTPGDTNGKALIVNASFTAGEFYNTSINGLCENTTYEFSSWLTNILPSSGCGGNGIPVNVKFEIWDITDTNLLASGDTGNIFGTPSPTWEQYGLVFQTLAGQTSVILKMINNGVGGCGNDLAIDDIVFKSCGDLIEVEDSTSNNSITLCSSQTPYADTITAIPDNAVFSSHFYQWQISTDGITWLDIVGETNASISFTGITTTTYYRAKVAEFQANLSNSDCITLSDVYEITVNQAPPPPITECWETATFDDDSCSWLVSGIQPPAPTDLECWETATFNNTTCAWEVTGIQPPEPIDLECWETATFNNTSCSWEVTGAQPEQPSLECWETATFNNVTCAWEVTGTQPPEPTGLECWETAIFNNTTCAWEVTGSQPEQPALECWETATFNNTTCAWEVTGTQPPAPIGLECWETATFNNGTCSWEVTGSQPEQPLLECWETATFNNTTCIWEVTGTQPPEPVGLECWEVATFNDVTCSWEVTGSQPEEPTDLECWESTFFNEDTCEWEIQGTQPLEFRDEFVVFCEGEEVDLIASTSIINAQYQWDSGEISESISVGVAGTYAVEVTDGCFTEIITFTATEIENPEIESITSDGSSIIVNLTTSGIYQYSIDGVNYQYSNIFNNQSSGLYTIYVKSPDCDYVASQTYFHFYIQKFITPNDDGDNDFFVLNVAQFFASSEVYIFDRYGKLLYSAKNANVFWDGTYNGKVLPASDYWYRIVLEGREIKGHFSIRR